MTSSDSTRRRETTVFFSVSAPDDTTKFVDQIVTFAPNDIRFKYFSWRTALLGKWDVFHVHWPEFLVRGRTVFHRLRNRILFLALLARVRAQGKGVVRTVHNLQPHQDGDPSEARLLARLDAATSMRVRLTDATPVPSDCPATTILHGDYRYPFRDYARSEAVPGRLLYFGRIEPYKGVDRLIEVFASLDDPRLSLRIVGRPTDALRRVIAAEVNRSESLTARLEYVSDRSLVEEVTACDLVVLPYSEMHNSGVLLVALSLNKPVLAPTSAVNERIRDEVGSEWLHLYSGNLTSDMLRATAERVVQTDRPSAAWMPDRSWEVVAERYAQVYRSQVGRQSEAETPRR